MTKTTFINATYRLMYAVILSLIDLGCFHEVKGRNGPQLILVPTELAHYDHEGRFVWIELDAQRLPRNFSLPQLREQGFIEEVSQHFRQPVVVNQIQGRIIVAATVSDGASANGRSSYPEHSLAA